MAGDTFKVSPAAAGAVFFFRIEGNHGVSTLPGPLSVGEAAKADAVADGPDTHQPVELPSSSGDTRSHRVSVVQRADAIVKPARCEGIFHRSRNICAFELLQVW
jgi:hypothetical protein